MRSRLSSVNLTSDYWSHAIHHAVYIKNRLPHNSLPDYITHFEAFTNRFPDLPHIRVFFSHVTVKQPRIQLTKLDTTHSTKGVFLYFAATHRIIWFEDNTAGELKSARHMILTKSTTMQMNSHLTPNKSWHWQKSILQTPPSPHLVQHYPPISSPAPIKTMNLHCHHTMHLFSLPSRKSPHHHNITPAAKIMSSTSYCINHTNHTISKHHTHGWRGQHTHD